MDSVATGIDATVLVSRCFPMSMSTVRCFLLLEPQAFNEICVLLILLRISNSKTSSTVMKISKLLQPLGFEHSVVLCKFAAFVKTN